MSSDKFPTSLVLILAEQQVVGHVKLSEIKLGGDELMIESSMYENCYSLNIAVMNIIFLFWMFYVFFFYFGCFMYFFFK